MRGLNKAQIIGRLGSNPVTSITKTGLTMTTLSVATNERWHDAKGQLKEATEWHRITLFGKLADTAAMYLEKGDGVYIEGKIKTQRYTDKQGIERWSTSIFGDNMEMFLLNPAKLYQRHYYAKNPGQSQAFNTKNMTADTMPVPKASPIDSNIGF